MVDDDTVVRVLNQHRLLSPFMLSQAQRIQGRSKQPLFIVLLENNLVDEAKSLGALSAHMTTSCVSLSDYVGNRELLAIMPKPVCEKFRALPLGVMEDHGGRRLIVAMVDPSDFEAIEGLSAAVGMDIEPVLVGPRDFQGAFTRCFASNGKADRAAAAASKAATPPSEITLPEPDLGLVGPAHGVLEKTSLANDHDDHVLMGGAASAEHAIGGLPALDDDPLPWERYDSGSSTQLAGLLERADHSAGPFGDDDFDEDERAPTAESMGVDALSLRPPTDDAVELPEPRSAADSTDHLTTDTAHRQRSNVFRQFMRKSSVIVLGPPTKEEMPDLDSIPTPTILKATVELLLEKGLFELYEFEQAVAAIERARKAK
jgi:hypothetical protein